MNREHNKKRLLVIVFHYPPDNTSTGVLRTAKFTKYLEDENWECDVITVPDRLYYSTDSASITNIPKSTRVFKTWAADARRMFGIRGIYPSAVSVPDNYWPWIVSAVRQAGKLIKEEKIDAIFATYPVPSALLIGLILKKKYKLPWIADFRDPWVEDSMSPIRRAVEGWMERAVLQNADRVICNTNRMREWFLRRYGDIDEAKFVTIPNGYDEADLEKIVSTPINKFEILYTGIITSCNRNPRPLFEGVRVALDKGWLDKNDLQLTFLGAGSYARHQDFNTTIDALRLRDFVSITENRIPYLQALGRTAGADVVVVLSEPLGNDKSIVAEREWSHLQVPAKVYECLGLDRKILALVSGGAVEDVLLETGMGSPVDPYDVDKIALALKDLYQEYKTQKEEKLGDHSALRRYSRRNLTAELARELNQTVAMSST